MQYECSWARHQNENHKNERKAKSEREKQMFTVILKLQFSQPCLICAKFNAYEIIMIYFLRGAKEKKFSASTATTMARHFVFRFSAAVLLWWRVIFCFLFFLNGIHKSCTMRATNIEHFPFAVWFNGKVRSFFGKCSQDQVKSTHSSQYVAGIISTR